MPNIVKYAITVTLVYEDCEGNLDTVKDQYLTAVSCEDEIGPEIDEARLTYDDVIQAFAIVRDVSAFNDTILEFEDRVFDTTENFYEFKRRFNACPIVGNYVIVG